MSNCTLAKAVLDWNESKERLEQLTKLMNEAFIVFDYESVHACNLSQLTPVVEKSWAKFTHYSLGFSGPDYDKVWEASFRVSKAFITRKDFNEFLTPYKESIEKHVDELSKEVDEKLQHIISLYDNSKYFAKSPAPYFFKQDENKKAFMQFLLS